MSQEKPIAPPWLEVELVENRVLPGRVIVQSLADGSGIIRVGGLRVNCTLDAWRALNAAVEAGFAGAQFRPVPARTDGAA